MDLTVRAENKTLYFSLSGELDQHNFAKVKDILDGSIERYFYEKVVFDFKDLKFMDSTGIGMLIGRYKMLKSQQKPCYIANASFGVDKILRMTGIYSIMPKITSEEF